MPLAYRRGRNWYHGRTFQPSQLQAVAEVVADATDWISSRQSIAHWQTNHGFFDAWLMKLDSEGHYLWSDTWGGSYYDDCPGVAVDQLGYVYASGL